MARIIYCNILLLLILEHCHKHCREFLVYFKGLRCRALWNCASKNAPHLHPPPCFGFCVRWRHCGLRMHNPKKPNNYSNLQFYNKLYFKVHSSLFLDCHKVFIPISTPAFRLRLFLRPRNCLDPLALVTALRHNIGLTWSTTFAVIIWPRAHC